MTAALQKTLEKVLDPARTRVAAAPGPAREKKKKRARTSNTIFIYEIVCNGKPKKQTKAKQVVVYYEKEENESKIFCQYSCLERDAYI